jgi:magnesium transporter
MNLRDIFLLKSHSSSILEICTLDCEEQMFKLPRPLFRKKNESPLELLKKPYEGIDNSKTRIEIMDYDAEHLIVNQNASLEECIALKELPSLTWIHVHGVHNSNTIQLLGSHFGLHPLIVEDVMSVGQRPKLDDYKDNIYLIVRTLKYDKDGGEIEDEQVSVILGENYVISFVETDVDIFEPVRNRLRNKKSRIRSQGVDYLAYALIDLIVDHYFEILEQVDQDLEDLEEQLIHKPRADILVKIQNTKRKITYLRKSVWPMREVISHFRRIETPLIQDSTKLYIQDVYDHTIQTIDTIESFRDIVSGMFDIYLSNINLRMNEIMKVLTIVSTIFVPLTFVASLYGMNFDYIPGLHSRWGYFTLLGFMILVAIGMLLFFRKKKWI